MHTVGKRDRGCYASSRKQWLSASGEGKYIWFGSSGTGRILPQMEEAWEKAQRWDEAQVIGSSSKKVFGLLLLASLIAYFLCVWNTLDVISRLRGICPRKDVEDVLRGGRGKQGQSVLDRVRGLGQGEGPMLWRKKVRPSQGQAYAELQAELRELERPLSRALVFHDRFGICWVKGARGWRRRRWMKVWKLWWNGWGRGQPWLCRRT